VASQKKKSSFNPMRLLAFLLLLIFLASSGFYLVKMTLERIRLGGAIEEKQYQVEEMDSKKRALEAEINRLKAEEKVFADTLKIMQDDLPTLEVLNAVENSMASISGMAATSLRLSPPAAAGAPGKAVLEATSVEDAQIVQLTTGLSQSGVFSGVVLGNSTLDEKTGRVTFTLNLDLRSMGQIRAASGK
jgi:cell division protein FtsB